MALEFLILTTARSGEVLGAQWQEIDLEAKIWTVPAARMKAGREHRVPLSGRTTKILEKLAGAKTSAFVFPGQEPGKSLSAMALEMVLRRMKVETTVFGFRAAFRDWCGEETHFPREVAEAALAHTIGSKAEQAYRRGDALEKRRDADSYVELWLEKDALSGVILPDTKKFDVPLMVARGYASETFLPAAGDYMATVQKPYFVYDFGDLDPSGQDAARAIEKRLRQQAPGAEIHFERIAVTQRQIDEWNLPTRPTKQTDSRAKKFGPVSVELDAINPNKLRKLVAVVIVRHLPHDQYEILMVAEKSERKLFQGLAGLVKQLAQRGTPGIKGAR